MTRRAQPTKLVVDESVSDAMLHRFERHADGHGLADLERLFVAERHPGMPDARILHELLDRSTLLLTNDRPFHNEVLSRGLKSCYVDETKVVLKPLPGIRPRSESYELSGGAVRERGDETQPALRAALLPQTPKQLKNLRTKRRRIRNHFGGLDNLAEVAVTVSWCGMGQQILVGVKVRVAANVAIKALDASERYLAETVEPEDRGRAAVAHALVLVVQLMLQGVRTTVYYDTDVIDAATIFPCPPRGEDGPTLEAFLGKLAECFERLELVPTSKGPLVERLRSKLHDLSMGTSNEIVQGNLAEMMGRLDMHGPQRLRNRR